MEKTIYFILTAMLILYASASAIDLANSKLDLGIQSIKNGGREYIESYQENPKVQGDNYDDWFEDDESIFEYDYKSPKRAFVYSLLIPGWGQKYAGSHAIKPLFFLAAEAGLWMGYFMYHNDGNKKTDEYEAFADLHWALGRVIDPEIVDTANVDPRQSYTGWLAEVYHVNDDDELDSLTHHVPDVKNQQYYEMIGKYDQFRAGWDDYWLDREKYDKQDSEGNFIYASPNRETYENMRKKANDLLDRANKFIIVSLVNHIASAIDAAFSAKRYNRNKAKDMWLTFRAEMKKYSATEEIPVLTFSYKF
jgi:hypothetical protein